MALIPRALWVLTLTGALIVSAFAQDRSIVVASTTSTEQSGLFGHILPIFTRKTGLQVKIVALGTGQALEVGRRGDADVVFVHDRAAEDKFVADGAGVDRRDVMYNDFVLVGPKSDPAKVAGSKDIVAAMKAIAETKSAFVSRADKSGTHAAELRYFNLAGVDPIVGNRAWYRETGSGMGPALNTASAMNAYILADRATWLAFKNRGELRIAVEGDRRMFNPYGVIIVNPARHPHVKKAEALAFIDWLVSAEGQAAVASYGIDGEQLFFPDASKRRRLRE